MDLSLGLPQLHWGGALVPRGSSTWGLTHRAAQTLRNQCGSREVSWQLNQHLVPHIRRQTTQAPIQHLCWGGVGDT